MCTTPPPHNAVSYVRRTPERHVDHTLWRNRTPRAAGAAVFNCFYFLKKILQEVEPNSLLWWGLAENKGLLQGFAFKSCWIETFKWGWCAVILRACAREMPKVSSSSPHAQNVGLVFFFTRGNKNEVRLSQFNGACSTQCCCTPLCLRCLLSILFWKSNYTQLSRNREREKKEESCVDRTTEEGILWWVVVGKRLKFTSHSFAPTDQESWQFQENQ